MTDYQKYQLEWLIEHDVSLDDVIAKTIEAFNIVSETANADDSDILFDYTKECIEEVGFHGECYACESEWNTNERTNKHDYERPGPSEFHYQEYLDTGVN